MDFLILADQWLVHYASTTSNTPIPTLFAVGHALELYLKAALLKCDKEFNVRKRGHDILPMISILKNDYNVLKSLDVNDHIMDHYLNGSIELFESDSSDAENYRNNIEFYWVARLLKDIKYLGTYCESIKNGYFLVVKARNPYWIPIIRELRQISIPDIKISHNYSISNNNKVDEYIKSILF